MMSFFASNQPLFDFFLISLGIAFSQQIVLRAGVFSIASAGFVALGAYCTGILVTKLGWHGFPASLTGMALGAFMGFLLSVPLARLRGVYQAIATLAFVEIVIAALYYFEPLTGGAVGLSGIPKLVNTWHLLIAVAVVIYLMYAIGNSIIGRSFDALRQDETVAACLGVSIRRYHALAFILSGAIAGFFGGMQALYFYTVSPEQMGFAFVVSILTAIVLGGRTSLLGPILGVAILSLLPEIARPLAENRLMLHGLILIVITIFLPNGVGDSLMNMLRRRKMRRIEASGANAMGRTKEVGNGAA